MSCCTARAARGTCSIGRSWPRGHSSPTRRSWSTVDYGGLGWHGHVGVVTTLFKYVRLRSAHVDGDDLRPGDHDALRRRANWMSAGCRRRIFTVSMERNMKCARRVLRALPVGPALHLQGRPGLPVRAPSSSWLDGRGRSEMARQRKPKLGGLEVRLLRRLPAQPARLRGRTAGIAGAVEIAYFPEASRAMVKGPYDICRLSKARSPRTTTRSASSEVRRAIARRWSRSARAPPRAAFRRCAT